MRWQELFADLEAQAAAEERVELEAEIADRSRGELAEVELMQRLSGNLGAQVSLRLVGTVEVRGRLTTVGADWLLLDSGAGAGERLVPVHAVLAVRDLGPRAASEQARGAVMSRLGLASPLRAIVRNRAEVRLVLTDGSQHVGTPERVGADHLDLHLHEAGEVVRRSPDEGRMTVPFSAITVVRLVTSGWG